MFISNINIESDISEDDDNIYDNQSDNRVVYGWLALMLPIPVLICLLYIIYKINKYYFPRLQIQEERIALNRIDA